MTHHTRKNSCCWEHATKRFLVANAILNNGNSRSSLIDSKCNLWWNARLIYRFVCTNNVVELIIRFGNTLHHLKKSTSDHTDDDLETIVADLCVVAHNVRHGFGLRL